MWCHLITQNNEIMSWLVLSLLPKDHISADSAPGYISLFRVILYLALSHGLLLCFPLGCHSSCSSSPCHQQPECQHTGFLPIHCIYQLLEESSLHQTQSINKSMILHLFFKLKSELMLFSQFYLSLCTLLWILYVKCF